MSAARKLATVGMLVGVSLALHVAESLVPSPLPFLKVGLSNIVTLFALLTMGVREAVVVAVGRAVLASLITGTFGGPAFALSVSGGLSAALGMSAAARWAAPPLGVVGVSVVGAACHNLAQVAVVSRLFAGAVTMLVPAVLFVSAGAGLVTGLAAKLAMDRFGHHVGTWRSALA